MVDRRTDTLHGKANSIYEIPSSSYSSPRRSLPASSSNVIFTRRSNDEIETEKKKKNTIRYEIAHRAPHTNQGIILQLTFPRNETINLGAVDPGSFDKVNWFESE